MERRILDHIDMIGSVNDFAISEKAAPLRGFLHYNEITSELRELKEGIDEGLVMESQETTGEAKRKQQLEEALTESAYKVVSRLKMYATFNNDAILLAEVNYSKSVLRRMTDRLLISRCRDIETRARALDNTEGYRLSGEMLDMLKNDTDAFENSLTTIRLTKTANSSVRSDVADMVKEAMQLLNEKLDVIVESARDEYPQICEEYDRVRTIIDR